MKKILIVIGSLHIGGQEKMSVALEKNLINDYQIYFLVYGNEVTHYEEQVKNYGFKVIHIPYKKYHYIAYYRNLKSISKTYGPFYIMHCHGMFNIGMNMFFAYLLRIPKRISHCHSTNNGRDYQNIISLLYDKISKILILNFSTDLLACGNEAGLYLYGEENKSTFKVVPNGIDYKEFGFNQSIRNSLRKEFELNDTCKVYGIVARLTSLKNHLLLIDIFKHIMSYEPDSVLLIVGDGEMREEIQNKVIENKMEKQVFLLGNRDDINSLLSCMDFFILPSEYEGFPVSIVEAQVNGLVCFISSGINKEVDLSGNVYQFHLNWTTEKIANFILSHNPNDNRGLTLISPEFDINNSRKLIKSIYES